MLLELQDVHSFYGTSHILHGVTLRIPEGGMVSVLGRNGVGKTTLVRSIMGVLEPSEGQVLYKGQNIGAQKSHRRSKLGISYVPQGRELIPDLTVDENLRLALMGCGKANGSVPDFVYGYFPAIKDLRGRRAGVLSGGQQQQVAIARALVQEPELLLLDEPTEGLQPSVVTEIQEIIKRIHSERNCAILLVEQNLDFVREVTQQFAMMENGRILVFGNVSELTEELVERHLSV